MGLTTSARAKRIMSLTAPEKKMSKSDPNPKSRILVTDSASDIKKKVNAALTDSIDSGEFDFDARPGWSNLVQLLYYLEPQGCSIEEMSAEMAKLSKRVLKERLAAAIDRELAPVRERYLEYMNTGYGDRTLHEVAQEGAAKATASAEATMKTVREAVGLD
jgi:tryptophanyl-tRNA synthetase